MNVVLVVIDTLRADHLGCYGYPKPTSPTLDSLAQEGVLFEQCIAPAIPTHPAHTTIFTGLHPIVHGIVAHGGEASLSREFTVLPEVLQRGGVTTCAVDNLAFSKPWFLRGYEFYINPGSRRPLSLAARAQDWNARALPWLRHHAREPFFLFLHYWDPHTPYLPPLRYRTLFYEGGDPCDPTDRSLEGMEAHPLGRMWRETWFPHLLPGRLTSLDFVVAQYDGEIRNVDDALGELVETLEAIGAVEETLLLITSDHGEALGEHRIFFDHHGLYECNVRVPLVAWGAGVKAGHRVRGLVSHLDLAPTIVEAWGLETPPAWEGQSLWPFLQGQRADGTCEEVVLVESTWQCKWGLRTPTHKFILAREPDFYGNPEMELYDLRHDPQEEHNLALEREEEALAWRERLEGWIAERLSQLGRSRDPVVEQGMSLGAAWKRERSA